MKDPVHLICACNSDYILPLSVMLSSVVDHFDRERQLVIHVLNNDATEQQRADVAESIRLTRPGWNGIDLQWHAVDAALLANFTVKNPRHTMDVFSRLFAPYLLPETCERAVYLDCDTVVLADISRMYDTAAKSPALLHAVHDMRCPWVSSEAGVFDYKKRGIPADAPYFNSGVLVIHLKRWRELEVTKRLMEYIVENGPHINEADQGALNALLHDQWEPLDLHWNSPTPLLFPEYRPEGPLTEREWNEIRDNPWIVHYTGAKKPWLKGVITPRYSYFFRYLQKTVYKNSLPHRPRVEALIGIPLYYWLWTLVRTFPGRGLAQKLFSTLSQTLRKKNHEQRLQS